VCLTSMDIECRSPDPAVVAEVAEKSSRKRSRKAGDGKRQTTTAVSKQVSNTSHSLSRSTSPALHLFVGSVTMTTESVQIRGSVVRTSVINWRTFPDLRLIYG